MLMNDCRKDPDFHENYEEAGKLVHQLEQGDADRQNCAWDSIEYRGWIYIMAGTTKEIKEGGEILAE
jgi:hypothetical protein